MTRSDLQWRVQALRDVCGRSDRRLLNELGKYLGLVLAAPGPRTDLLRRVQTFRCDMPPDCRVIFQDLLAAVAAEIEAGEQPAAGMEDWIADEIFARDG
jgi:hypothetical protein